MLGSKDLGTNVFRTLMCNVGKPRSKLVLVLFRLAQSVCVIVKLELSGCRSLVTFSLARSIEEQARLIEFQAECYFL